MHILKPAWLFAVLIAASQGCTPQAALTPQAAFYNLKTAFEKSDAASLERQLSAGSVRKIRVMTRLFSSMDDRQLNSLAGKYGVEAARLRRLSVRDYCALALALDRGKNVMGVASSRAIIGIDRQGGRATIRVDNGMELVFVKEGPYWMFDMAGL